jgi:hypothetical protein
MSYSIVMDACSAPVKYRSNRVNLNSLTLWPFKFQVREMNCCHCTADNSEECCSAFIFVKESLLKLNLFLHTSHDIVLYPQVKILYDHSYCPPQLSSVKYSVHLPEKPGVNLLLQQNIVYSALTDCLTTANSSLNAGT